MSSRKPSSLICVSLKRNVVGLFSTPVFSKRRFMSSCHSTMRYCFVISIMNTSYSAV